MPRSATRPVARDPVTLNAGEFLVANVAAASSTLAVAGGGHRRARGREGQRGRRRRRPGHHRRTTTASSWWAESRAARAASASAATARCWCTAVPRRRREGVRGDADSAAARPVTARSRSARARTTSPCSRCWERSASRRRRPGRAGQRHATVRASAVNIAQGGAISGAGTLSGFGGGSRTVMLASIDNQGSILASGGNLLLYGAVSGSGTLPVGTNVDDDLAGGRRQPARRWPSVRMRRPCSTMRAPSRARSRASARMTCWISPARRRPARAGPTGS